MSVKETAKRYEPQIIGHRRHLHMHPELSMEEFATTDYIAAELDALGIPFVRPLPTGLVATIQGKADGPCVALRADIDALNVTELNDVGYKSMIEGKMHACGHDAHAAMLLGAAKILSERTDQFAGKVKLIFQPGEEVLQGARQLMAAGDWFEEVDNLFGAHIWANLPSGTVSLEGGPRMAAADIFKIHIKGRSGHGSMPNQGVDASLIAAATIMNMQALVSRETSPLDPLVLSVGILQSGNRVNILPGTAYIEGNLRYFSRAIGETIQDDLRRMVEATARTYRGEAVLEYTYGAPPLINDDKSSELALQAAAKIYDPKAIVRQPATTGSEDFAFYVQNKPGVFAFIGSADPAKGTDKPHHSGDFNVDETVLADGAALYAQYALDYLEQQTL